MSLARLNPARYRPNPWTPLLPMLLLFLTICATSAEDVTSGQAPAQAPAAALPEAAVAILTSEHDQEAALRAKLDQDLGRLHQAAIVRLKRVEDRALSAKDLDGAQATKTAILALQPKAEPDQGHGILINDAGKSTLWDNTAPIALSADSHTFTFYVTTAEPTHQLYLRSKPGYGCERIILDIEGRSGGHMQRDYGATLTEAKDTFRIDATHTGSNDGFAYGPLQYRLSPDGEWADIPTAALTPR
jgi:hypothetical protein